MTDTTGALPPAGWYPDPYGAPFERWWDGQQWTEHTNTPAAPEPVPPAKPEPYTQPDPFAQPEPYAQPYAQPEPYRQAEPTPSAEPSPYAEPEPVAPVSAAPVSSAYVPPVLDEPYGAAPADPFAGFVTPSHNPAETTTPPAAQEPAPYAPEPYQPEAYQPEAFQQPPYQPEAYEQPAAFQPSAYEAPEFTTPEPAPYTPPVAAQPTSPQPAYQPYTPPAQGYDATTPAAPSGNVGANPPSSFDFGFGAIVSGDGASAGSHDSGDGDSGLFGSWAPDEYVEPPRNGPASAGLALGILSFFLSVVAGIPGLIVSAVGIGKAARLDREGDGPVGRGRAVAGLLLSILGSGATAALIVLYGLPLLAGLQQPDTADGTNTPDSSDVELTQNGGIPLDLGAIGMIVLPDSADPAIQFSVTSITPNFACTADPATVVAPTNGQYIAVTVNFTTNEDYLTAMDGGTPLHMSQSDWIGFLPDENGTQVINTESGNSCIPASEQFPADIPAGANVSGTIVLDMAADVFSLSWGPTGVTNLDPGITRWEWEIPVGPES